MVIEFQYSQAEYVQAAQWYYSRLFHMQTYGTIVGILLVLAGGVWLSTGAFWAWLAVMFLLLAGVFPFIAYFVTPRLTFWREPRLRSPYRLDIDADGIRFEVDGYQSQTGWNFYQTVWENEAFYLLFYAKNSYIAVPKRAFAAGQETRFRELLHTHGLLDEREQDGQRQQAGDGGK